MSANPTHTVQTGTIGGTPVIAELKGSAVGGDPWAVKQVRLTQNYTAINPPGYPDRPPIVGATGTWKPGVITSGTTRPFHAHEAAAIVAAGGGVIVG